MLYVKRTTSAGKRKHLCTSRGVRTQRNARISASAFPASNGESVVDVGRAVGQRARIQNVEPVVALAMLVRSGRRLHASRSYVKRARAERRRAAGLTKPRRTKRARRSKTSERYIAKGNVLPGLFPRGATTKINRSGRAMVDVYADWKGDNA